MVAAAALTLLAAAPSAHAAFGFGGGLAAGPADSQAGANSDFTITIPLDGTDSEESVRDMTVHLPPGLVGNPTATPLCTAGQLNADACPAATQVGEVTAMANLAIPALPLPEFPLPTPITGSLYNLEPEPGEPARFGIVLSALPLGLPAPFDSLVLPSIKQQTGVSLRDDGGLDTVLEDTPNSATILALPPLPVGLEGDIRLTSLELSLFGNVGGKGFIRNPTSCKVHTVGFDATAWDDDAASGEATFETDGCDGVPFSPELSGTIGSPGHTDAGTKPPLTAVIEQAPNEAGLSRAAVILPAGVGADSIVLGNTCTLPQFEASSCPPSSVIGSASAQSPLLTEALAGDVSLVAAPGGGLPKLGVDLKGPLALQLLGNFLLSPGPGNEFVGLPDIPISRFALTFNEDKLVLTTRDLCAPPVPAATGQFEGHNGAKTSGQFPLEVKGCGASATGDPTAKVKLKRSRSEHPRMKVKVKAGSTELKKAKLKLPRQLRFGPKLDFKRGAKGSSPRGKARKLKLKSKGGAKVLKARVKGPALDRVKTIKRGKRLRFPTKVTDVEGTTTKLKPRAKAR